MSFPSQRHCVLRVLVLSVLTASSLLVLVGCSQEPVLPGDRLRLCLKNSDCESGWVCILNACQIRLSSNSRDGGSVALPDLFTQDEPPKDKPPVDNPPVDNPPVDQPPVGCRSTADCKAPLLCKVDTGKCVQCLREPDCNGQLCRNNQCVPCTKDTDCASTQACQQQRCVTVECSSRKPCAEEGKLCKNYKCVACQNNAECGVGKICSQQKCIPGECIQEGDCQGGKLCKNFKCVPCNTTAECGKGRICEGGACKPGQCTQQSDCAVGLLCKNNKCVNCLQDGECASGQLCLGGFCKTANCRLNKDCSGGQVCRDNKCGACLQNGDCATGELCLSGACKVGNCQKNEDCTGGLVCKSNQCSPCAQDTECKTGLLCLSGACKVGCRSAADCKSPVGQVCLANKCSNCTKDTECKTGEVCDGGLCKQPQCLRNSDCPAGQICKAGACTTCTTNADCGGNTCLNGVCKIGVASVNGAKRWADGTFAESCEGYLKPSDSKKYQAVAATGREPYWIQPKGQSNAFQVLCIMESKFYGGGWTLVLKIDGSKSTFKYTSSYWTDSKTLAPTSLKLDGTEAKFASFHTMPFKGLMIWMADSQGARYTQIETKGKSLQDIFKGKKDQKFDKPLGRGTWISLLNGGSVQSRCNQEGFNINAKQDWGAVDRVRMGIMFNEFNSCISPDTFVGIGNDGSPSAGGRRTSGLGTAGVARFAFLFLR